MNKTELMGLLKTMQGKLNDLRGSLWLRKKRNRNNKFNQANRKRRFLEWFRSSKQSKSRTSQFKKDCWKSK